MSSGSLRLPVLVGRSAAGGIRVAVAMRPLATGLTLVAVALLFLLSDMRLTQLGIPYVLAGGNALTKIHPGTYVAVLALAAAVLARGPVRFLAETWAGRPGVLVYAVGVFSVAFQGVVVQKLPSSIVVDTLLLPLMLFLAIGAFDETMRRRLAAALLAFMAVNALIGIAEAGTGWRLTPFYLEGEAVDYDWRSTALLGHPLANSASTGLTLVLLAFGAGRMPGIVRVGLIGLLAMALAAFGGRTATVGALALVALAGCVRAGGYLAGRRFRTGEAIVAILVATAGVLGAVVLHDAGAFDRFLDRFVNDYGSADTRVEMLGVFRDYTLDQLLFVPDLDVLGDAMRRVGLLIGIESFVVGYLASHGVVVSAVFFGALAAFCAEIVRSRGARAIVPVLFFLSLSAASTGISTKTLDFAIAVTLIMGLLPPAAVHASDRRTGSAGERPC